MRLKWMVTLLFVTQFIGQPLVADAQEGDRFENFMDFIELMEASEVAGEPITEEDMIEYFGTDYEYISMEETDGAKGMYNYDFEVGDTFDYYSFILLNDGSLDMFSSAANTGESSDEQAQLSPEEYIQWAREFISLGKTDIDTLDEQYTLEAVSYSPSFIENAALRYQFDGVTVEYEWPTHIPTYYTFEAEFEDAMQLEYTAEDAQALYETPALHFDDVVEVIGNDWLINYNIATENFAFTWYSYLEDGSLQNTRVSVDEANNVLHFLYTDPEVTINGVVN